MAELFLVRHGQAAFGSGDYDRLTELGMQQSRWLGEYFAERGVVFDVAFCGRQRRHRETLEALLSALPAVPPTSIIDGLDEYDFGALIAAHAGPPGVAMLSSSETSGRAFYTLLRDTLAAWAGNRLNGGVPESWAEFGLRIGGALAQMRERAAGARRVLAVCSGGPVSRALGVALQLPDSATIGLNLQLRNSAFAQLYDDGEQLQLVSFNSVPHLDRADRRAAITSV
ncbi:MAG TPA: histidine phosphatase family protein [Gammaproteobacteria bacterium]